jgi:hypothetical protein
LTHARGRDEKFLNESLLENPMRNTSEGEGGREREREIYTYGWAENNL